MRATRRRGDDIHRSWRHCAAACAQWTAESGHQTTAIVSTRGRARGPRVLGRGASKSQRCAHPQGRTRSTRPSILSRRSLTSSPHCRMERDPRTTPLTPRAALVDGVGVDQFWRDGIYSRSVAQSPTVVHAEVSAVSVSTELPCAGSSDSVLYCSAAAHRCSSAQSSMLTLNAHHHHAILRSIVAVHYQSNAHSFVVRHPLRLPLPLSGFALHSQQ